MSDFGLRVTRSQDNFVSNNVRAQVHSYEAIRERVPDYKLHLAIYRASFPCPFAKVFPLTVGLAEIEGQNKQVHVYHFCDSGELLTHLFGSAGVNARINLDQFDMDLSFLRERLLAVSELLDERKPAAYFREHPAIAKLIDGSL